MAVTRDNKPAKGVPPPRRFRGPWGGMAPDIDPQLLPDGRPYLLHNVRLEGGIWVQRGGQRLVANLGGKVLGMVDHQMGAARPILVLFDNSGEIDPPRGLAEIGLYDGEANPVYKTVGEYELDAGGSDEGATINAGVFGEDILFGVEDSLYRFASGDTATQELILTLPSPYQRIAAIREHEGTAVMAVRVDFLGDGTDAGVFTFDGVTFTLELSGIQGIQGFATWRDKLIAVTRASTGNGQIRVRSADGTWGSWISPTSGSLGTYCSDAGVSYRDKCYLPSMETGAKTIFVYDGTTLEDTGVAGTAVAVFGGNLYYLTGNYIGKYDGTTWNDSFNDISYLSPGTPFTPNLRAYRNALWLNSNERVLHSPLGNPGGVWSQVNEINAADYGDSFYVRDFLVY